MTDIPQYPTFVKIEPLNKGWSSDKKYTVETTDGKKLLLRVADISEYDHKKTEFDMMQKVAAQGVPMQQPIDFGVCDGGKSVYQLLTWIDGEDAETALPMLTEAEQYSLGVEAGEILKKMQTLFASLPSHDWLNNYGKKIDGYIRNYQNCGITSDGDELLIHHIEENRHLLDNRPTCFTHDDYHPGNMILTIDKKLCIIDFQQFRNVEPYHAMSGLVFSAKTSPHFATGQIHGYFKGEPPADFWRLLSLYMAVIAVNALPWSIPYGQSEIDFAHRQIADILYWFDNMQNPVPSWYLKDFYIQYIDGVPLKLKSAFDLSFLRKYGKVFKVFDDQDSGNICFGVTANDGKRYFVKFAGAPTERYKGGAEDAITRLKATTPIYRDLAHPTLITFVSAEEIGGGFALVFEWVDAICAQRMYPKDYIKFKELPLDTKRHIFGDIMEFHAHVAERGYVAIDFYDGSIMYDLANERTVICDIDFYQKSPYVGSMGLWGSTRFVSPEERTDGAVIDEVTNVYTMGATAFCLFADSDRSLEKW
ncbi:MAG: phosphotransferase, partial [Oscillospiraceae bacterium]|nr:phosphotransferase [Oscillospiraceae bacterium]